MRLLFNFCYIIYMQLKKYVHKLNFQKLLQEIFDEEYKEKTEEYDKMF